MPTPHATLADWIAHDLIPFNPNNPDSLHATLDHLLASAPQTEILALGEPTHLQEPFLQLRNQIFQHLALHHNFTAIAIESSFTRGSLVTDYVLGGGAQSYDEIQDTGFSHNFGRLPANRVLVEWMKQHNSSNETKLRFHGCDAPTEMMNTDSPRQLLELPLAYLATLDPAAAHSFQHKILPLLGPDAPWENPQANFDHSQSIGLSQAAKALRLETENLIAHLQTHRPAYIPQSTPAQFNNALHHATHARHLLTYHAIIATNSPDRLQSACALRDLMMAENLQHILAQEKLRSGSNAKLFAFAHNAHLQRGPAHMQLGPYAINWSPAGAHLHHLLGPAYTNIHVTVAASPTLNLATPEPNTLESLLTSSRSTSPALLIPTKNAPSSPNLATRQTPQTFFPLSPQSLTDFNHILLLPSIP